jgi:Domain of unknown function (DUF4145)
MAWNNLHNMAPKQFTCGHCGKLVGSIHGYGSGDRTKTIYVCTFCQEPTYFKGEITFPGATFGDQVGSLPNDVAQAYDEARRCMTISAFTSASLMCRKVLMHIAVSKGETPGKSFAQYVDFLASKGYVPPDGKAWVDHIRQKGNEATHDLPSISRKDAEELLIFLGMLLRLVYEFPARLKTS